MALFRTSCVIGKPRLYMAIPSPVRISICGFPLPLHPVCLFPSVRSAVIRVPGLPLHVWNGKIKDVRSLSLGKAALKSANVYCCWSESWQRVNSHLPLLSATYCGSSGFCLCQLPPTDRCCGLSAEESSTEGSEGLEYIKIFHGTNAPSLGTYKIKTLGEEIHPWGEHQRNWKMI